MFNPVELTPEMGINRVTIEEFPDTAVAGLAGRRASHLLSTAALAGVDVREAGRRLGALVATLKDDRTARTQSTSAERRAALERWKVTDPIVFGGGIAARYGTAMLEFASETAGPLTAEPTALALAPHAPVMALVGLARSPGRADGDLLFDFGHSAVKRGRAHVTDGVCTGITLAEPVAVPSIQPREGAAFVVSAIAATIRELDAGALAAKPAQTVDVAVASYIVGGATVANFSIYMEIGAADLSTAVSSEVGRDVTITLHHDGTAAARVVAELPSAGVVTMGTSLGPGFPPPLADVAPLPVGFFVAPPPG